MVKEKTIHEDLKMNKSLSAAILLTIILVLPFLGVAYGNNGVSIKKGDWIEYQVTVTGNPPPEYNITWARMDITGVQGEAINVSVQTLFGNGTMLSEPYVPLNIATGAIGDGFFIPTNLNPGDKYSSQYEGIINITSIARLNVAGTPRTVLVGNANQTEYAWDRQTGIMVAATSELPGGVMYTKASLTNIWQAPIIGLNQLISFSFIIIIIVVIIVIPIILIFLLRLRKIIKNDALSKSEHD